MTTPHPTPVHPVACFIFRDWKSVLNTTRLPLQTRTAYAVEIARFLRYCQILHAPVCRPRAREYAALIPVPSARPLAREALRWFFHSGQTDPAPVRRSRPRARRLDAWRCA